VKSKLIR